MNIKKKALSPIVATILLVVVSVILVSIILSFGKSFTNQGLDKTKDIKELSQSDAEHFVYPKTFSEGVVQFNYSPPNNFGDINITKYKILYDNNETEEVTLDTAYTLKTGTNLINLKDFSDQNVTSKKFTLILETDDNEYVTLKNINNPDPYVLEPYVPQQYVAGPFSPGTMVNDNSAGDFTWSNPNNAKVSDNTYVLKMVYSMEGIGVYDESVKIVKSNGLIGLINKAIVDIWPQSDTNFIYGGEEDLWGEEWTAEEINDSNFGVVLQAELITEGTSAITNYLKATDFNFNIPTNANINGIIVNIEKHCRFSYNMMIDGYNVYSEIDYISITVYYTK